MFDTFEKDRFNSLDFIGFPEYSVDISGICVKEPERTQAHTDQNGRYILKKAVDGKMIYKVYTPRDLVVASWSKLDEYWWNVSPFADDIRIFKQGFRDLPYNEKVKLPYTDSLGNGYWLTREGRVWREKDMREIAYPTNSTGYVNLRIGDRENVKLHRLVAHYFCKVPQELLDAGFKEENLFVNHIDGIKTHNHADNLEWVTNRQNMEHAQRNLLMKTTITQATLELVWRMLQDKKTNKEISEVTGIPEPTVSNIRNGASPRYKTSKYTWPTNKELIRERQLRYVEDFNAGMSPKEICEKYHISDSAFRYSLKQNKDKVTREIQQQNKSGVTEITPEILTKIYEALVAHKTPTEISRELGVSVNQVNGIKSRKTYRKEGLDYIWEEDGKIPDHIIDCEIRTAANAERLKRLTLSIGALYHQGVRTAKELAEKLHIDRKDVDRIARKIGLKLDEATAKLFTQEELEKIFGLLKDGWPDNKIAEELKVDPQRISGIRNRRIYAKESQGWEWPDVSPRTFLNV